MPFNTCSLDFRSKVQKIGENQEDFYQVHEFAEIDTFGKSIPAFCDDISNIII